MYKKTDIILLFFFMIKHTYKHIFINCANAIYNYIKKLNICVILYDKYSLKLMYLLILSTTRFSLNIQLIYIFTYTLSCIATGDLDWPLDVLRAWYIFLHLVVILICCLGSSNDIFPFHLSIKIFVYKMALWYVVISKLKTHNASMIGIYIY